MFELSYRKHGYILKLHGHMAMEQMRNLYHQLLDECAGTDEDFVMLVDARHFTDFSADAQALFEEMLEEAYDLGMVRITIIGISTALASLFCSIMVQTDLMDIYQFLDLAYETDWKTEMRDWLDEPFPQSTP
ncbi:hypothetical protein P3T73_14075 [Kiritimatiellota bacterium B12222]|nr:hypothetical protein P3T73_14075 [Kiritimatiellota bacterium B12222]